ncbi:site-specific DNA-methyltransferase [Aestuariivirga sp.]|uniref:site-specific DNA-methyltransferase n=1 Tax=Aestuariivirga sp. TaxID=2650926 RepID=UPI0035940920
MSNQLSLRLAPISSLRPPEIPLREHSTSKLHKLRRNIEYYGVLSPLLVKADGQIVDGVARYKAAQAAGLQHLPVIYIDHLSETQVRALRLSLNRLQDEATWDQHAVAAELRHLSEVGFDLDLTAFDTVEIENLLEIGVPPGDVEDLDASLLAQPVVTQPGDLWILQSGKQEHRVICGDVRNGELLQKLFGDERAAACVTDPPYNVRIRGHVSGTSKHTEFAVASGEMTDLEFESFLATVLGIIVIFLKGGAVAFIFMDWRHIRHLFNAGQSCCLELLNLAVWVKSNPGMRSMYRSQHELIAIFKRQSEPHRNNIALGRHGRSRSNVWQYRGVNVFGPERHLLDAHPTVKPVAMLGDAIRDVTAVNEIIFDPFLGSGWPAIRCQPSCPKHLSGISTHETNWLT